MRTPVVTSLGFICKPASTILCKQFSSSIFIWKLASALKPNTGFQIYGKVETGVEFKCGCRVPNVRLSGNRSRDVMRTPVSDFINVWKRACSIFWAQVPDLIRFWEPVCIISWTPAFGTSLIWKPASAKNWTPVSKNRSIWKLASKKMNAGSQKYS